MDAVADKDVEVAVEAVAVDAVEEATDVHRVCDTLLQPMGKPWKCTHHTSSAQRIGKDYHARQGTIKMFSIMFSFLVACFCWQCVYFSCKGMWKG